MDDADGVARLGTAATDGDCWICMYLLLQYLDLLVLTSLVCHTRSWLIFEGQLGFKLFYKSLDCIPFKTAFPLPFNLNSLAKSSCDGLGFIKPFDYKDFLI